LYLFQGNDTLVCFCSLCVCLHVHSRCTVLRAMTHKFVSCTFLSAVTHKSVSCTLCVCRRVHSRCAVLKAMTHKSVSSLFKCCCSVTRSLAHVFKNSSERSDFYRPRGSDGLYSYLTLPSVWAGYYTCPALRPYQFGPMCNPDVTRRSQ